MLLLSSISFLNSDLSSYLSKALSHVAQGQQSVLWCGAGQDHYKNKL